ncbi:protein LURP-one-related 6-like [Glycine soja]|uniref:Protein LURP-one-related 6 n=1 Tax=Glycine soja TaxID=3848 RepID=A0A0B2PJX8_GLYSO|nr:protein LURP-one-related 6-like [Glycine soja]KHN07893.1 Protein LURP-one-related 6 [Glycine soja]RZB71942.1 Protein LURP-one-related 6 [Glycine soja]
MIAKTNYTMPIIGKLYCSSSETVLVVRRRPHVVNGGGFVVMDCSAQRVVFRVDGCGVRGKKGDLILREGDGDALLLMRRMGGMVEALSIYKKWKGYSLDYEGSRKLVFSLRESNSCLVKNNAIRIFTRNRGCDFKISGCFPDKCCSIVDSKGNEVAQVRMMKEVEKLIESKDLYHVVVNPGMDQAFVFGVIAILDYIYGESTHC